MLINMLRAELYILSKTKTLSVYLTLYMFFVASAALTDVHSLSAGCGEAVQETTWAGAVPITPWLFLATSVVFSGAFVCQFVFSQFDNGFALSLFREPRARCTYVAACLLISAAATLVFLVTGWVIRAIAVFAGGGEILSAQLGETLLWFVEAFACSLAVTSIGMLVGFITSSQPWATLALLATAIGLPSWILTVLLSTTGTVPRDIYFSGALASLIASLEHGLPDGWSWLMVTTGVIAASWALSLTVMRRKSLE